MKVYHNMRNIFKKKPSKEHAPLAYDLPKRLRNYNRALSWLATAGSLDENDVKTAKKAGFKTIIDLRTAKEGTAKEKFQVENTGMNYVNIEITTEGISSDQLDDFSQQLEKADKPVLLHCASAGRVGAMMTLYYIKNGMDKEMAFELGRAANMPEWYEELIS